MNKSPIILIAGASRGIGAALGMKCAKEGYRIALNYLAQDYEADKILSDIRLAGAEVCAVKADVRDPRCVEQMFEKVAQEFGGCDYLVNNAHTPFVPRPFLELRWDEVQEQIDGSLKSVFLCCQAAIPVLRPGGAILNMSSVTVHSPAHGFSHRSAAKGAVEALTKNLALELACRDIRVNALSIGWTATDQIKSLSSDFVRSNIERVAMRRLASPEEIANAAFHYVSPESSFITGSVIPVDGGCFI